MIKLEVKNNLKIWNIIMGCLHLVQGIFMYFISKEIVQKVFWTLPKPVLPEGGFKALEATQRRAQVILESQTWFEINLGHTIAGFLLMSAIAHFVIVLPKVYPWYEQNLAKHINYVRWIEYSISSSLMIFVIAMLCNVTNAAILIPIIMLNCVMNLFGMLMEMYNSLSEEKHALAGTVHKTNWAPYLFGCLAGITPWIVMGVYFVTSLNRLQGIDELSERIKDILALVKWIFPGLFIFFNLFAINMYLQYKKVGPWKDYLYGEKAYILLSLLAKSFLAWFIWGGTLR